MLDFEDVLYIFLQYTKDYDDSDTGIERKILHTYIPCDCDYVI